MALRTSVTAQEYDQTLRAAVNAYYEHAINDPSMSREEAINSTAQMAEQYLAASEEFQANLENASMTNETGNELSAESVGNEVGGNEAGGIEDGGMEGGDTGGIDSDGDGIE